MIRAWEELGIATVAVYSKADRTLGGRGDAACEGAGGEALVKLVVEPPLQVIATRTKLRLDVWLKLRRARARCDA